MIELQKYLIEISTATNESQIDHLILDAIKETSFVAFLFSVEREFFNYIGSVDPTSISEDRLLEGLRIPVGQALTPFATRRYAILDNLELESEYSDLLAFFINRGCRSAAIIPLNVNEKATRLLIVGSRDEDAIGQTDILPIQEILVASEKILGKKALESSSEKQTKALELFRGLTELISKDNTPARLLPFLHSQLQQIFGREKDFSVALHDREADQIQYVYVYENGKMQNPRPIAFGEGLFSYIIKNKRSVSWLRQASNALQRLGVREQGAPAQSFIGCPLMVNGEAIGVMSISDTTDEDAFQDFDISLMSSLSTIIASVLAAIQANKQKIEQIERSATNDIILDNIFDFSPMNLSVKDTQGKYLNLNKQLVQQLGIPDNKTAIGQSDIKIMNESEGLQNYKDDLEVISSGFPKLDTKISRTLADGSEIILSQNKVPLKNKDGNTIGLLEISWDDTELRKTQNLAQTREAHLNLAAEIIHSSTESIALDAQLKELMNGIQSNMKIQFAGLYLLDTLKENAVFKDGSGETGEKHRAESYQIRVRGKSILNQALSDGNYRIIPDTARDQNHIQDELLPNTRSELIIPLRSGGDVLGFIDYRSEQPNFFTAADLQALQLITDQIALIISNASQGQRTKDYLARQRSMYLITSIATTAPTIDAAYMNVVEGLADTLPNTQISIFVPDDEGSMILKASQGQDKPAVGEVKIPKGEGIIGQVASEQRTIVIDDVSTIENYVPLNPKTQSELAIPIMFRDTFFGAINIESPSTRAFNENDIEILSTLANSLGSIISSVQLVGQIRDQVDRQQQLYTITDKIRRSVDIETILKTSVEELGKALKAKNTQIQITGAQGAEEAVASSVKPESRPAAALPESNPPVQNSVSDDPGFVTPAIDGQEIGAAERGFSQPLEENDPRSDTVPNVQGDEE